jgi:hypothetical protein
MVVKMERIAPILPVRDVPTALAHYQQLGFEVRAYGASGEANPEYGFARFSASRSSPSLTFCERMAVEFDASSPAPSPRPAV